MRYNLSDIEALPQRQRAALINCLPGIKPVMLVGTADANGATNLSVVSSCFHLGSAPALLGMIIRPSPDGTERHTLDNLLAQGCYTLNAITPEMTQRAHHTAARFPKDISEFDACQLAPLWDTDVSAPFVAESPLRIALSLQEHQPLAINGTHLVIGAITQLYCDDGALREDGSINLHDLGVVGCAGLDSYHAIAEGVRYNYAKPDHAPHRLT